jgi:hypothetical protein
MGTGVFIGQLPQMLRLLADMMATTSRRVLDSFKDNMSLQGLGVHLMNLTTTLNKILSASIARKRGESNSERVI